ARVHAVESMPILEQARALAAANGLADRIVFHAADAVELPPAEPVDLVVSDFLGAFLHDDLMLPAVAAAARWLKPGGGFIPAGVRPSLGPAGAFGLAAIDATAAPIHGVDVAAFRRAVLAAPCRVDLTAGMLLAGAQEYLVYRPGGEARFDRSLTFTATR